MIFFHAGNWIQGLRDARQTLNHWATSPAMTWKFYANILQVAVKVLILSEECTPSWTILIYLFPFSFMFPLNCAVTLYFREDLVLKAPEVKEVSMEQLWVYFGARLNVCLYVEVWLFKFPLSGYVILSKLFQV
jgi:hypothetical protein